EAEAAEGVPELPVELQQEHELRGGLLAGRIGVLVVEEVGEGRAGEAGSGVDVRGVRAALELDREVLRRVVILARRADHRLGARGAGDDEEDHAREEAVGAAHATLPARSAALSTGGAAAGW